MLKWNGNFQVREGRGKGEMISLFAISWYFQHQERRPCSDRLIIHLRDSFTRYLKLFAGEPIFNVVWLCSGYLLQSSSGVMFGCMRQVTHFDWPLWVFFSTPKVIAQKSHDDYFLPPDRCLLDNRVGELSRWTAPWSASSQYISLQPITSGLHDKNQSPLFLTPPSLWMDIKAFLWNEINRYICTMNSWWKLRLHSLQQPCSIKRLWS